MREAVDGDPQTRCVGRNDSVWLELDADAPVVPTHEGDRSRLVPPRWRVVLDDIGAAGVIDPETFDLVQASGYEGIPGWLVEGLAEIGRTTTGNRPTRAAAYGVTGRFLLWIDDTINPDFTRRVNERLRTGGGYGAGMWNELAGDSLYDRWDAYVADAPYHPPVYWD